MQAAGSSKMMVTIYQVMWFHILEDSNPYGHDHENFEFPNPDERFG
jgi:hypothetical protein